MGADTPDIVVPCVWGNTVGRQQSAFCFIIIELAQSNGKYFLLVFANVGHKMTTV